MDLRGEDKIKMFWGLDEGTGDFTMTVKNDLEDTVLGELIIEGRRFRSLMQAWDESGRYYFPDQDNLTNRDNHRSLFDNVLMKTTTEFYTP